MALGKLLKRLVCALCAGLFVPDGGRAQSIVFDGREVAGHFDARTKDALADRVDGVIVVAANGGRIIHLDRYGRMGVGTEALETARILLPLARVSALFTTLLAVVFLHEQITLRIVLGMLSIVAGVGFLTGQQRP